MEVLLNDIEVLCLAPPYFGFKILAEYFLFSALLSLYLLHSKQHRDVGDSDSHTSCWSVIHELGRCPDEERGR